MLKLRMQCHHAVRAPNCLMFMYENSCPIGKPLYHTPWRSPSGEHNIHGGAGPFIAFYEAMGFHSKELIFHLYHQENELNDLAAAAACSLYLQLSSVFQCPFPLLVV